MADAPNTKLYSFTMDCIAPYALATFYATLLKWEIPFFDEDWALRAQRRGHIPASHSSEIPHIGRPFGRRSRNRSSKWPI